MLKLYKDESLSCFSTNDNILNLTVHLFLRFFRFTPATKFLGKLMLFNLYLFFKSSFVL